MIKPDAVDDAKDIFARIEAAGLYVAGKEYRMITVDEIARCYPEQVGKRHYNEMVRYLTSRPIWVMVLEGPNAISTWRGLLGATRPWEAGHGTIRADYGGSQYPDETVDGNIMNAGHGSDAEDNAEREIQVFFPGYPDD